MYVFVVVGLMLVLIFIFKGQTMHKIAVDNPGDIKSDVGLRSLPRGPFLGALFLGGLGLLYMTGLSKTLFFHYAGHHKLAKSVQLLTFFLYLKLITVDFFLI